MKLIGVCSVVLLVAAGMGGAAAPEGGGSAGGLVLRGQTEAVAKVEVPASVRGQLLEVNVKEGQRVKKGEVLARIDDAVQVQAVELARLDAEAEAELKLAEAHVEYAQVEYERWEKNMVATEAEKRLKKLQLTQAELEREQKKEQWRQKQVVLKREQITLERMTIRSPIDGVVLRVNKAAGESTDETPLVVVVQITRLSAVFYPPKQMFAKVRVGDKVKLEIATEPSVQREAVVVTVDPIIDPASGLFRVKLELDNAEGRIPAGTAAVWEGAGR
jgi:RND family efflux transporter MFP subunit